jgi:hypothetical protein
MELLDMISALMKVAVKIFPHVRAQEKENRSPPDTRH